MAPPVSNSRKIPFESQIECKFAAPLDNRCTAPSMAVLVTRPIAYNYDNMVVFIEDEMKFVTKLANVDGSSALHWVDVLSVASNGMRFMPYIPTKTYLVGDAISLSANMYICISDASENESPITNPEKWLPLGITRETVFEFTDTDTLTIPLIMANPIIAIWYQKDANNLVPCSGNININSGNNVVITFSEAISGKVVIK